MSKKRRRTAEKTAATATPVVIEINRRRRLLCVATAAGLLGYVWWFFGQPLAELTRDPAEPFRRVDFFIFLLTVAGEVWRDRWLNAGDWAIADRAPIVFTAALILAVGWMAGRVALRIFRVDARLSSLERPLFALGVGLNLISLGMLLLGLAGLAASRAGVLTVAAAIVAASAWQAWRDRRRPVVVEPSNANGRTSNATRWLLLGLPFAVIIALGGILPASDFDVREYHLQAPKEYFQLGRITFLPHNVYANMPLGSEMHSLLGMTILGDWWMGALVGKLVQASFALWTSLLLLAAGRRWFSGAAGALAAVIYLSTPWIVHVSIAGLVEGAAAFYAFAALYAWMLWRDPPTDGQAARPADPLLLLTGFLAGSAVAIKYPAALFVVTPLGGLVIWYGRPRWTRQSAIFLIAVAAACGPWLAKNAWFTGNPTYPLLYRVFGGATWTPEKNARWRQAHRPPNFALTAGAAGHPRSLTESVADVFGRSPWLNAVTWPLAALALAMMPRDRRVRLLWGYVLFVIAAWWLFTHRIDRFWLPMLPMASLLAGGGICALRSKPARAAAFTALAIALVWNFTAAATNTGPGSSNRFLAPLAQLRVDAERVPPWKLWLNRHTPPDRRVICEGDAEVFDLEMPIWYHTAFDDSPLAAMIADKSAVERREALADTAYVYVDWNEINRYRSPGNYGYTEAVQPSLFEELVDQGVLAPPLDEFRSQGVEIYPVR